MVAAVQGLLRHGLPVTPANAADALLDLRGIVARSIDPDDEASRTVALNGTLRGLLARYPDSRYAAAARALFGLPPAVPGQNLTTRRELAAELAGHELHHFRKRVEPKLAEKIAWELLADAERFTRSPMIAPRLAPTPYRQAIVADPFAWEVAEHEEQLSRLWSAIYAARAALLATERLVSLEADRTEIERAAVTAAWRWTTARTEAINYTTAFAPDQSADDLIALAGWTPDLTPAQTRRLVDAASADATREQFAAAMRGDTELSTEWIDGLRTPLPTPSTDNTEGPLA